MFDVRHELKDAGLVASNLAGTVDGQAQVLDVGFAVVEGVLVIDVSAIEIASNNEKYAIKLQGSVREDFAHSYEDLAVLELGAKEVLGGDQDSGIGVYAIPFANIRKDKLFPYLRLYTVVSGDVATGINFTARLTNVISLGLTTLTATTTTTTSTTTSTTSTTI